MGYYASINFTYSQLYSVSLQRFRTNAYIGEMMMSSQIRQAPMLRTYTDSHTNNMKNFNAAWNNLEAKTTFSHNCTAGSLTI